MFTCHVARVRIMRFLAIALVFAIGSCKVTQPSALPGSLSVANVHVASEVAPARFVLSRDPQQSYTTLHVQLSRSRSAVQSSFLAVHVLGKESHLHKVRVCSAASPSANVAVDCAQRTNTTSFILNLDRAVQQSCFDVISASSSLAV